MQLGVDEIRVVVDAVERLARVEIAPLLRAQELQHQHVADAPRAVVQAPAPAPVVAIPAIVAMHLPEAVLPETVRELPVPAVQVLAEEVVIDAPPRGRVDRGERSIGLLGDVRTEYSRRCVPAGRREEQSGL